jgi:tetratricopeptide (TPR) repeat protein
MRKSLVLAALLLAAPAYAAPSELDKLFAQLAKAEDEDAAKPIEDKITGLFRRSGSATVDLLMTRVDAALAANDKQTARKLIGSVTSLAPGYAEGWHARAAILAEAHEDSAAMVSLQKAVQLNPRQFDAMMELGSMLEDYGDKAAALKLYRRALALNPQMEGADRRIRALTVSVEGRDI